VDVIADAAADVGAPVVYFAAGLPPIELRRFALERGGKYFALPAGPKLLGRVLASALRARGDPANADSSGLDAVTAAVAAVARARVLASRTAMLRSESHLLRAEHDAALADCRRSQAGLREAVIAYTRELRGAGLSPDRVLEKVKEALGSELTRELDDAVEWCLQAYYAA